MKKPFWSLLLVSSFAAQAVLAAPKALPEPSVFRTKEPQEMSIYNGGAASLQKRLEMIQSAKRTIEAEFFIYGVDQAGRVFSQALAQKAKEGVKVRVLIDYGWPIADIDPYYAEVLNKAGVEVRYYNPAVSFELFKGQFRSHRKALIIDDIEGMTGGRNIADEYFDLSPEYNFLDRDIVIRGSLAKAMRESFDVFWNSKMTKNPGRMHEPLPQAFGVGAPDEFDRNTMNPPKDLYEKALRSHQTKLAAAQNYLIATDKDREVLESLKAAKALQVNSVKTHTCTDSVFAADLPGIGPKKRSLFGEIKDQLSTARKVIHVESPYFVTTIDGMHKINSILRRGVEMNVYTNSLNSTDAVYTTSTFYPRSGLMIGQGLNIFIYRGQSLPSQDFLRSEIQQARWGIHAKSAVIDERKTLVGTFNVDPRSRNINAEMAVMCLDSAELAQDVLQSMKEREAQSVKLNILGKPVDGTSAYAGASIPKRIMYYLTIPFSNLLAILL